MKRILTLALLSGLSLFVMSGCGPTYPDCENDEHCAEQGEHCVNMKCKQCAFDSHCNATNACMICGPTNACVEKSGCCNSSLDCPKGKCWKDDAETGTCGGGGECRPNVPSDCAEGFKCWEGSCEPVAVPFVNCAKPVYFDFNEHVLTSDARTALKENAACIKNASRRYQIEGHCDERGTEEYNLALGEKRADESKRYLINSGVSSTMLTTVSLGEERSVCYEHSESCWWKNRRAEFLNLE